MFTIILAGLLCGQNPQGPLLLDQVKKDMIRLSTTDPTKPLDDLNPLNALLNGAQVVGIGEATHGTSEFCAMKHRMFRYLVEKQGFTVFGLEASMPECLYMDDYVMYGKGDPKAAVVSQGFWTWSTQEMLDLITWMRQYNLDPKNKKKLRVVGYDMQSQVGCTLYFEEKEKAIKGNTDSLYWEKISYDPLDEVGRTQAKAKLGDLVISIKKKFGEEEGQRAEFVERVFFQSETNTWIQKLVGMQMKVVPTMRETFQSAANLIAELKLTKGPVFDALTFIDAHKSKLIDIPRNKESAFTKLWIVQANAIREASKGQRESIVIQLKGEADLLDFLTFTFTVPEVLRKPGSSTESFRDESMARNIVQVSKSMFRGQKMMVWAHNGHIMRTHQLGVYESMGSFLNSSMGKSYYPIGFAFESGSFNVKDEEGRVVTRDVGGPKPNSLESILAKTGQALFFTPTKPGFGAFESRSIGASYRPEFGENYYMKFDVNEGYSGMIYIKKSTPSHLLK